MKATVSIERGKEHSEKFVGEVLAQTDSHLFVQHGTDPKGGEWFAVQSKHVNCAFIKESK